MGADAFIGLNKNIESARMCDDACLMHPTGSELLHLTVRGSEHVHVTHSS